MDANAHEYGGGNQHHDNADDLLRARLRRAGADLKLARYLTRSELPCAPLPSMSLTPELHLRDAYSDSFQWAAICLALCLTERSFRSWKQPSQSGFR